MGFLPPIPSLDPVSIGAQAANDLVVKDTKVHLSTILADAGWGSPKSTLNGKARAIVQRESNGDPTIQNRSGATGLFQIMTPLWCGHEGVPKANCVEWLKDPRNNAKIAHGFYTKRAWKDWQASGGPPSAVQWDPLITTNEGSLTDSLGIDGAVSAVGDAASTVADIAEAIAKVVGALFEPSTYLRLGKGALGVSFLIIGVGVLAFTVANKSGALPAIAKVVK